MFNPEENSTDGSQSAEGIIFNFAFIRLQPSDSVYCPGVISSLPTDCSVARHRCDVEEANDDWSRRWIAASRKEVIRFRPDSEKTGPIHQVDEKFGREYPLMLVNVLSNASAAHAISAFISEHQSNDLASNSEKGTRVTWESIDDVEKIKDFARVCTNAAYRSGQSYITRRNEASGSRHGYVSELTLEDPQRGVVTIIDIPLDEEDDSEAGAGVVGESSDNAA